MASYARKHSESLVYAAMCIALAGGLVYSLFLGNALRYSDEVDYYIIGGNIAEKHQFSHDGVNPTAFRPPGYPFLIAAFRFIGLGVFSLRMANFVFLALGIYFLYRILQTQKLPLAGAIAGLLVLGYPVLFYAAGTLFPQILASSLFLLVIWLCVRDGEWKREVALAGLAFGYLILTVPYFLLLLPMMALHPWILGQGVKWRRAALLVVVATCVTGLWTGRNFVVFQRLIPVSTHSGVTPGWRDYLRCYVIEHWYRFANQFLHWKLPQLSTPEPILCLLAATLRP